MDYAVSTAQKRFAEFAIGDDAAQIGPDHLDWRSEVSQMAEPEITDIDHADFVAPEQ
jgi:hypothetical protein